MYIIYDSVNGNNHADGDGFNPVLLNSGKHERYHENNHKNINKRLNQFAPKWRFCYFENVFAISLLAFLNFFVAEPSFRVDCKLAQYLLGRLVVKISHGFIIAIEVGFVQ